MDLKNYIKQKQEKMQKFKLEKQYAIGEHLVSQEQFNFIKGCFAENVLPPDFTIHRKTWGNGMPELPGIPDRPMVNCDVIKYKDTVFAEFNGYWEFAQESKINGVPPITEKDLSHIGTRATMSNDRQMLQWERWRQPDSSADLGIFKIPTKIELPDHGQAQYEEFMKATGGKFAPEIPGYLIAEEFEKYVSMCDSQHDSHVIPIIHENQETLEALLNAIQSDVETIDTDDEPIKDDEEIGY